MFYCTNQWKVSTLFSQVKHTLDNGNKLIRHRQYIPKSASFKDYSDEQIKEIQYKRILLYQHTGIQQRKLIFFQFCCYRFFSKSVFFILKSFKTCCCKISRGQTLSETSTDSERIDVSFPNGVQLSYPVGIDIGQLKKPDKLLAYVCLVIPKPVPLIPDCFQI